MTTHFSINFDSLRFTSFRQHDLRCLKIIKKINVFRKRKEIVICIRNYEDYLYSYFIEFFNNFRSSSASVLFLIF